MSPEAQQMAIAEVRGWREAFPVGKTAHPETLKGGILLPYKWVNEITHKRERDLPDYLADLNAMHEAWQDLSEAQKVVFGEALCAVVKGEVIDWGYYPGEAEIDWSSISMLVNATAAQRAQALLVTLNLWKDDV